MRILIIEDEITLNRTLQEGLIDFGYQVDTAENYKDAEYFIDIRNYDLVLTDWMLPDGDGIELCKIVKNRSSRTAVVIISARDDKESEIEALKSGADDFIKKPFDFDILLARIEARLRFGGTNIIEIDDLIINPDEEKIEYAGEEINVIWQTLHDYKNQTNELLAEVIEKIKIQTDEYIFTSTNRNPREHRGYGEWRLVEDVVLNGVAGTLVVGSGSLISISPKAMIPANGNSAPPSSPLPPEMRGAPDPTQDDTNKNSAPDYQVENTPGMDPNRLTIPQVPVGDQNVTYQPGQRIMDDKGNMGTIRTGNTKLRDNKGEFFAVEVYWDSGKCDFISTAYVGLAPTNQEIQEMAQQQQEGQTQEVNQSETFESSMEEKLNYLNGHGNYEVNKMIKTPNNSTAKSDESNFSLDGDKLATQLEIEKFKKYGVIKDPATGKYVPGVSFTDQMAASIIESTAKGVASTLSSVVAEIVGTSVRELNNIVKTLVRRTVKGDFRNAELNKEAVSKVQTYLGKMIEESNPTGANVSSSTIAAKRKSLYIPPSFQAGNYSLDAESDEDFEKDAGEVDKNFKGNYSDSTQNVIQKRLSGIAKSTAEKGKINTMKLLARAKSEKAQAEMVGAKAKEMKAQKASFSMLPSPKDGLYVKRGLNSGALSASLDSRKTSRDHRESGKVASLNIRSDNKAARDSEKRRLAMMKKDGVKLWSESDIVTPVSDITVIKKTTLYGPGSDPIDTGSDLVKKVEFSDIVNKNITPANNIDVNKPEDAIKNLANSQIAQLEKSSKNVNMSNLDGPAEWFVSSKSGIVGPLSEGDAHNKYLAFSEKDPTTRMYKDSAEQVGFSNFSEKSLTLDEKIDWLK
jgi:CheY-like chemotaxis protein